ncbi:MAG: metalloregulator ArsR/SmtB family transcription factor [Candidatus Woesearchaeota archaeon]
MIKEIGKFKAIGDETRFRILRILIKAQKELCACEIINILKKPQYTISKHLGQLVNMELINEKRIGRMMFYYLNENIINSKLYEAINSFDFLITDSEEYKGFINDINSLNAILEGKRDNSCKTH